MTRAAIGGAAIVTVLGLLALALAVREPPLQPGGEPATAMPPGMIPAAPTVGPPRRADSGFLYGRITADGAAYEGRLRWGGDQEAFWGDYFDGAKDQNPWAAHTPLEPPAARGGIEIFGFEIGGPDRSNLRRSFLARFGDIARVEAHFARVHVTLKSGTVFALDRFAAGDIDDGVRVWDVRRGIVDLDARQIRTIDFLPTAQLAEAPDRLHGVVRTRQREFTGFIQWDQTDGVSTDALEGRTGDEDVALRYDTIQSIARQSRDTALVTLLDGRARVLANNGEVGRSNRGIYVDDTRYGRVLISWDAFDRVELNPGGSGPAYGDFPPGRRLSGSVTTRGGRRHTGRLVYDLDESETTETLDVSSEGVDYAVPFGQIAFIIPAGGDRHGAGHGSVTLVNGEELRVERSGDLGDRNAGVLVFADGGGEHPEYVPWAEIARIDFDRSTAAIGRSR